MVFVICGAIVGVLVAFFMFASEMYGSVGFVDVVACCFFLLIGCAFGAGAGAGIAAAIGAYADQEMDDKPSHSAALASLRSSDGVKGSYVGGMFLGIGVIESETYYFYYERVSKDSYTPRKVRAGVGVYVNEQDRTDGELKVYSWHFKRGWLRPFAFTGGGKTWKFYVPKGSLVQGFRLQ